jgi:anti-anti-sigma factor
MQLKQRRVRTARAGTQSEPLVVGWERGREAPVIWLSGTLDRVTATLLDSELDARPIGTTCLVVDLTGLEYIDASGLDTLARIHRRATERGDKLSFQHGQHVARRPLGLIRAAQLRSAWAPTNTRPSEDSYFAHAMACADVGHPGLGDRPRAA